MKVKVARWLSCCLFLVLLLRAVETVTYLFRSTGYGRLHVIGMYEEGPLDMVYIGSSSAFTYWQPLKAWNDCGFTSYAYAENSFRGDGFIHAMKEVYKTHTPELFVIDLRSILRVDDGFYEPAIRNCADSMDLFSINRWRMIWDYMKNQTVPEDEDLLSYYFDLAKYHTNTQNLASQEAWEYRDNRAACRNKGWEWFDTWEPLTQPEGVETDERASLEVKNMDTLIELLEYCRKEDTEVLFAVSPYQITREDWAKYNTMSDIIESYGYRCLNANDYYREMGIDFSTDFYNGSHANLFGAEKYTDYLEHYMAETYSLSDHRGQAGYDSWQAEYIRFAEEEAQHRKTVAAMIKEAQEGRKIGARMQQENDTAEWAALAEDQRFVILISEIGRIKKPVQEAEAKILKRWGLDGSSGNGIRVISDQTVLYTNEKDGASRHTGTYGSGRTANDHADYSIDIQKDCSSIQAGSEEFKCEKEGVYAVVVDKNYLDVVDAVNITNCNGELVLAR